MSIEAVSVKKCNKYSNLGLKIGLRYDEQANEGGGGEGHGRVWGTLYTYKHTEGVF